MKIMIPGDPHCPAMHKGYPDFLNDRVKEYKPDLVIFAGDIVDNHCISYHEKSPNADSGKLEVEKTIDQIKDLKKVFKRLPVQVMTGNHDALPQRKAATYGIPQAMVKKPWELWECKEWYWQPRFSKLERDGVLYMHGDHGSRRAAACPALINAKDLWRSVVQGHFHSLFEIKYYANEQSLVFGMQVGCGMDHESYNAEYGQTYTQKPILGCGFVIDGIHPFLERMVL